MQQRILFFCSEGLPLILGFFCLALAVSVLTFIAPHPLLVGAAIVCFLLFLQMCYFFRDPGRIPPERAGTVIAPADGKILSVQTMEEKTLLKAECVRVSVFMNIFSVHVNRAPISGKIIYYQYNPGKFVSAFKEKASLDNEQVAIGIESGDENTESVIILVKLIAGLIARRIVVWKKMGDDLVQGERMSLIKLGSRVDLYLPSHVQLEVQEGDWVKAGETVIGTLDN